MQWLILRASSPDLDPLEFARLDNKQNTDSFKQIEREQIQSLSKGYRVILLIPSEEVVISSVKIPAVNNKQLEKAIPFAMEEMLAEEIDELHFVHHREHKDDNTTVAVINKERLREWLDGVEQYGLSVAAVLPDAFTLPLHENGWSLLADSGRALMRTGNMHSMASTSEILPLLLPSLLEKSNENIETLSFDNQDNLVFDPPEQVSVQPATTFHRECHSDLLEALPLNLKRNFHRDGRSDLFEQLLPWKGVAAVLALIVLSWAFISGFENHRLQKQLQSTDQAIGKVFKEIFPDKPVDSDYRILHATVAEQLEALGASDEKKPSPLAALASIAPKVQQNKQLEFTAWRFDAEGLSLSVTAPSLSVLENFRSAIDSQGIDAEVKTSTSSANKVEAVILVREES